MPRSLILVVALAISFVARLSAQVPLDSSAVAQRRAEALVALDRYLETWNSRDAATWATSLHFPHVRPGPGAFELTRSPEEYAKGVSFEETLKTGWHHSEWVSRDVLQVGENKVHVAGTWQRYTRDDKPLAGSDITYVITRQDGRWGVQARFAAGVNGADAAVAARNSAAAIQAVSVFLQAWNSHDHDRLAAAVHYPHVRVADGPCRDLADGGGVPRRSGARPPAHLAPDAARCLEGRSGHRHRRERCCLVLAPGPRRRRPV